MPIRLAVVRGPHAGLNFTLEGYDLFLVGRSSQAHFRLPSKDPFVSRNHFLIEANPPLCRLWDLESHNGTFVNSTRVQRANLAQGDVIRIGQTEIEVHIVSPVVEKDDSAEWPTLSQARNEAVGRSVRNETGTTRHLAEVPLVAVPVVEGTPRIAGYRITRELGRGGMGVVYHAIDEASGGEVAIKTILPAAHPTPREMERFIREIDIQQKLDHPGIVSVRERGTAEGVIWFAMEYVPGRDAQRIVRDTGPVALGRVANWALQLLDALGHAHDRGFVHRDVKPANLLVTGEPGSEEVRLSDFGLARAYQASRMSGLTLPGARCGTLWFMPPEQVLDARTARPPADQYSSAATIYYLLAGKPIFPPSERPECVFYQILQEDPVSLASRSPGLPTSFCDAIHRALSRDPGKRFPHLNEFADAIRPFATS